MFSSNLKPMSLLCPRYLYVSLDSSSCCWLLGLCQEISYSLARFKYKCICLNQTSSFAIKVKCFVLRYHFINIVLIFGVLLELYYYFGIAVWQICMIYLVWCCWFFVHESLTISVLYVCQLLCFHHLNYHFCLILSIRHSIEWR